VKLIDRCKALHDNNLLDSDLDEQERIDKVLLELFFSDPNTLISNRVHFDPTLRYVQSGSDSLCFFLYLTFFTTNSLMNDKDDDD
jgi:hypothetical protein